MKEFIDSYEKDLQNSTELVNEDLKTAKNNFFKTNKSKQERLNNTIIEFCSKYNLNQIKENGKINPNIRGKREGDYNIRLYLSATEKSNTFLWMSNISKTLTLYITDADTDEPIDGIPPKHTIKVKYSWTEEELTKAINRILAEFGIKLTGSNAKIKEQQFYGGGISANKIITAFKQSRFSIR